MFIFIIMLGFSHAFTLVRWAWGSGSTPTSPRARSSSRTGSSRYWVQKTFEVTRATPGCRPAVSLHGVSDRRANVLDRYSFSQLPMRRARCTRCSTMVRRHVRNRHRIVGAGDALGHWRCPPCSSGLRYQLSCARVCGRMSWNSHSAEHPAHRVRGDSGVSAVKSTQPPSFRLSSPALRRVHHRPRHAQSCARA